jgi:hypothetical protein
MKAEQLRRHLRCDACSRLLGETGSPLFWVLAVRRYGLALDAIRRADGFVAVMGGSAELARVMGPNEDVASPLTGTVDITYCESCAQENPWYGRASGDHNHNGG